MASGPRMGLTARSGVAHLDQFPITDLVDIATGSMDDGGHLWHVFDFGSTYSDHEVVNALAVVGIQGVTGHC